MPEYADLSELKFEVQVRTVLQHAWAELAHDSNYKFSGTLPPEIDRKLYLYAGMLEIADKGFDELSSQIDSYKDSLEKKSELGDYAVTIDSISLSEFFTSWVNKNKIHIGFKPKNINELIVELNDFGLTSLDELIKLIPDNYVAMYNEVNDASTILGIVRDWMLISDWERFVKDVSFDWALDNDSIRILKKYIHGKELTNMLAAFDKLEAFIDDVDND